MVMLCCSALSHAEQQPFSQTTFEQLKIQHQGKKWLMVLWSVDCPACFKELALIKSFEQENLNLVIVNADDSDEVTNERHKVVQQYQLDRYQNYFFADNTGDQMRYVIDPSWYGELPRSYFVDETGKFFGKSGLIAPEHIKTWLGIP